MNENVGHIIRLAGLREDDMSLADIRAFFAQLPEMLAAGSNDTPESPGDDSRKSRGAADPASEVRGLLDDLTLVFRHALELAASRREISAEEDLDGLAASLTMIFRSVVSMSRRGHSADEIRRYLDIALGVLD